MKTFWTRAGVDFSIVANKIPKKYHKCNLEKKKKKNRIWLLWFKRYYEKNTKF